LEYGKYLDTWTWKTHSLLLTCSQLFSFADSKATADVISNAKSHCRFIIGLWILRIVNDFCGSRSTLEPLLVIKQRNHRYDIKAFEKCCMTYQGKKLFSHPIVFCWINSSKKNINTINKNVTKRSWFADKTRGRWCCAKTDHASQSNGPIIENNNKCFKVLNFWNYLWTVL